MKTYEDGLNEAWTAARKIACNTGASLRELDIIFDSRSIGYIFISNTAAEAISKIERYENQMEIEVGDEVVDSIGKKSVVMRVNGEYITVVEGDGTASRWEKRGFKKTGRHFPQIAEVLKQMQEGEA